MKSRVEQDYPLQPHNTFHIKARAHLYAQYDSPQDLIQILQEHPGQPILHIGKGSNLLFTKDFPGLVLHSHILLREATAQDERHVQLRVGSGEDFDQLIQWTLEQGWSGLENLSLIPSETGAAAVQNIGAYGVEVKDCITSVEAIHMQTLQPRTFTREECRYGYRTSIFKTDLRGQYAILYVNLQLDKQFTPHTQYGNLLQQLPAGQPLTPQLLRETVIKIRRQKLPDPDELGNAGSFYVNPVVSAEQFQRLQAQFPDIPHYPAPDGQVKIPAAWLIQQAGWKGRQLGPAAVHQNQPLVLVNLGGAAGEDILRLSDAIRADVERLFGIDLHPEVQVV